MSNATVEMNDPFLVVRVKQGGNFWFFDGDLHSSPLTIAQKFVAMNQDDFRKILATPRTTSGATAPPLFPPSRNPGRGGSSNVFKKPVARIRREGRSDALEHSHVDLGSGFVDRAKERRLAELQGKSGDNREVKGLDFELLKKVRSGEFQMPKFELPDPTLREDEDSEEEKEEEDMDDEAILDELLKMEIELQLEQDKADKAEKEEDVGDEETKVEAKNEDQVSATTIESAATEAQSRFKPVVDARVLKQMRREKKRRKLAMEAMDRVTNPIAPPPAAKKSRAELLAQLRQIQAARNQVKPDITEATTEIVEQTEDPNKPAQLPIRNTVVPPSLLPPGNPTSDTAGFSDGTAVNQLKELSPPPRQPSPSPPAPVHVGENMFSDESELSDYNPYADESDEEDEEANGKTTKSEDIATGKRNYFGDKTTEPEDKPAGPITMDPLVAAALRKATAAAAAAEKKEVTEVKKETKSKGMSLGGAGGVYEFDEIDTWDGEDDDEIGTTRKRKRKDKS